MSLPVDSHVHTQWSWDAPDGDMVASCVRAVELGLPAVAFTEHVDHTTWRVASEDLAPDHLLVRLSTPDGSLTPPTFDAAGYLAAVEDCRDRFPELRILSGVELGEPHRHAPQVAEVLATGTFDRVLGSVHTLLDGGGYAEPPGLFTHWDPAEVLRSYLAEVTALVEGSDAFEVLAHVDYPLRSWPAAAGAFVPEEFEDEFRHTLRTVAQSGRVLEVNTVVPFHDTLLRWWRAEGGDAITFGSDAHDPAAVARGFRDAVHLAEAHGFRPGRRLYDPWGRV
ncbi:PHP domain-containing protein [Nocardioides panacis]|uniref:Histidinol-phosphatase n=1 Tax=Nocardioides panacis TaxID=2849501 RepID=A0A975T2J2_9ACTN|nr:PHP domain-containing protein [Nocardioides panacis]